MFIFGGKKKEEKKSSIDPELRRIVGRIMSSHGEGLYQLLARASPDGDVEKIKKMLAHNRAYNGPEVTIESKYRKLYVETKDFQHEIAAAHYPILHAFLALALAYHTGSHSPLVANVAGDILTAAYQTKADYSELKKRKEALARAIAKRAKERGITSDEDKTAKVIETALDKAFKIIDKIAPNHKKENLAILARAIRASTDDPFVVLRNAGIDIEPELEEFRQFLAEISGKKIEPAPKFKKVQKEVKEELRAKGMPEEVIKATAPRLATVRYFEEALNAMDHEVYRNLGGVPVEYIKKIRNMALAKKLAAEHIFTVWGKEGIRPVLLSEVPEQYRKLIEEYAKELYEAAGHLAEAHRKGELSEESVFNLITAKRDLADKIYEMTGRLISDPSALVEISEEHRTALKLLTKKDPGTHMLRMDRLKEYKETIKMHLEKTRPILVKRCEKEDAGRPTNSSM